MDISSLASLLMALGAPIVYADQAYSIYRKQDARGFSHDVCAVLLIANITRCFFWLGERFEFALLLQSLLMIAAQLGLLYLCIRFKPVTRWSKSISSDGAKVLCNANDAEEQSAARAHREEERDLMDLNTADEEADEEEGYADKQPLLVTLGAMFRGNNNGGGSSSSYGRLSSNDPTSSYSSTNPNGLPQPTTATNSSQSRFGSILSHLRPSHGRPLNFWQWSDYNSYLIFLFLYILLLLLLYILLSTSTTFIAVLGYIALGLESTLPIPQLISNYKRKSLAGFRASVLVGWVGGDSFKLLYFVLKASPVQFTACAVFQLSVDLAIVAQGRLYRAKTEEEEEGMRRKAEQRSAGAGQAQRQARRDEGEIEVDASDQHASRSTGWAKAKAPAGKAKAKAKTKTKAASASDEHDLLQDPHHVISIEADDDDDEEGDISNGRK